MSSDSHYIGITVRISKFVEVSKLATTEPCMNTSSSVIAIDAASFKIIAATVLVTLVVR